ncbi:MAG: ATP-binding protein [Eubacterium sp.]|nr:ATP-binding protein [Eubacterium sp.]
MARTIAIGEQDFSKIIEQHYFYIDKTNFIKEWWENGDTVTLITRPRRFGKTLTMSMLEYFFSVQYAGRSDLFEGLSVWREEGYRKLQGSYPVIFLSFAGVKADTYKMARKKICQLIVNLYKDHEFLADSGFLKGEDLAFYNRISVNMDRADMENSLGQLARYLCKYYKKKVILLLDEYDTPMQEAYVHGFWDELVHLMRGLLNAAFKTNAYLERGIMTGITRVGKESVFSDLNNPEIVTTTSCKYAASFGFTEEEVLRSLEEFGLQDKADGVKRWYDGFRFGKCGSIYNPWSITQFLEKREFKPYWANTSSNALIGKLIQESDGKIKMTVEDFIEGKPFRTVIDEQIVFNEIDQNQDAVWSLLLASGYLKIIDFHALDDEFEEGLVECELMLTNLEIVSVFRKMIHGWFAVCKSSYNDFLKSLLQNDIESMNEYLNRVALSTVSSFDSGSQPSGHVQPEKFYHGLILGMILDLKNRYVIVSNRESGFGRYDLLLEPRSHEDDGILFEFKVFNAKREKSLEDTVQTAIRQIIGKKYAASLCAKGVQKERIRIYGFAFKGKEVLIDGGYLWELEKNEE